MCPNPTSRRNALKRIGAFGLALGALPVGAAASSEPESSGCEITVRRVPEPAVHLVTVRSDTYRGVVDRIVDGRFVVILLEEGDRTIDQLVVPFQDLPVVEERDVIAAILEDGELVEAWIPAEPGDRRWREQCPDY